MCCTLSVTLAAAGVAHHKLRGVITGDEERECKEIILFVGEKRRQNIGRSRVQSRCGR